jgi:hypothetical protein
LHFFYVPLQAIFSTVWAVYFLSQKDLDEDLDGNTDDDSGLSL